MSDNPLLWDKRELARSDSEARLKQQLGYAKFKDRIKTLCLNIEINIKKIFETCPKSDQDKRSYIEFIGAENMIGE